MFERRNQFRHDKGVSDKELNHLRAEDELILLLIKEELKHPLAEEESTRLLTCISSRQTDES